ncbi:hypothetical protein BDZ91DRAFT_427612 [Kalaharituber pfeilii]|nr:hypothetical protein BDZ91DRAFT_427612 [Kalaharituber pfeilii]
MTLNAAHSPITFSNKQFKKLKPSISIIVLVSLNQSVVRTGFALVTQLQDFSKSLARNDSYCKKLNNWGMDLVPVWLTMYSRDFKWKLRQPQPFRAKLNCELPPTKIGTVQRR